MTAVLPTAATQASAGRCFQQPLRGSQRAYAWQRPPAAIARKADTTSLRLFDDQTPRFC
jgi:hypothetical protein